MNSKNFSEKNTNSIAIDEYGKVVVRDEQLAKVSEELTLDELEKVSGAQNTNCPNTICDIFATC
ncbi:MAG: hypothetical protein ACFBSE_14470 [Prochloraceae cyanobacterium]